MLLNYLIAILDRDKQKEITALIKAAGADFISACYADGTATNAHLEKYGLLQKEKCVVCAVTDNNQSKNIFKEARDKLYIDIPGNGIIITVPLKSVVGRQTLEFLSEGMETEGKPPMEYKHELIVAVMNEGYSDMLMTAARKAGAGGGTVLHAKGTANTRAAKFFKMSIADEKDIVYIVAPADEKEAIMKAINSEAGPGTKAAAICFSLPISHVMGLRNNETKYE